MALISSMDSYGRFRQAREGDIPLYLVFLFDVARARPDLLKAKHESNNKRIKDDVKQRSLY